jgi:hypothetical protein
MFIHTVYFWLRPDLSEAEVQQFEAGLDSLIAIESVQHGYWGKPAGTDREIIDRSYSAGLIIVFANQAQHDAYQVDPIHDAFREECGHLWNRVQIYDTITN